ncbi:MAG: hypothetical protein IT546_09140 [Caulobacteraceae bacterium]|nr:hypothetical protein [Caulobacteraceae bacterium]
MIALLSSAAAAAAIATSASALPPISRVTVDIGPELQQKAAKDYGVREVDELAAELQEDVERALAKNGGLAADGGRLELVLVDARPNRPTMKQMSNKPGLSMQSFGIGGATIEGRAVFPDGTTTPISYKWYESDIRRAIPSTTWSDAERTFDRFALRLARGGDVNASR